MSHQGTPLPSPDRTVADLMREWPSLVSVFLHRRMACPGCAMAPFMTLREAAGAYGIDVDILLSDLAATRDGGLSTGPFQPSLPHRTPAEEPAPAQTVRSLRGHKEAGAPAQHD